MNGRLFSFAGGANGAWRIVAMRAVIGETLAPAEALDVAHGHVDSRTARWALHGMTSKYLPAIARRLHHCRDLGENEPFDFLTWFEYAPADASAFDDLVAELRGTPEWAYVDREVDIRVQRQEAIT